MPDQNFGPDGPKAGDFICGFYIPTKDEANYWTCSKLAQIAGIENEDFFAWNPELKPDCSNIKTFTWYCVDGCKTLLYPLEILIKANIELLC